MSERWGDSRQDRESLDRHITGNYGEDQRPDEDACPECGVPGPAHDDIEDCADALIDYYKRHP